MNSVNIIIPVYNEEQTLEEVIKRIEDTDICGLEKRLIFVDDGSTDRSREILSAKCSNYTVIFHDKNYGKGSAIWTGLQRCTADIVIIQDADLEYDINDYNKILPYIINGESQVVYGSRLKDKDARKHFLVQSYYANKFLTLLTNILFSCKISDMETCYKAFKSDVLNNVVINSKKFEFEIEITAKILKQGISIKEVPISYNAREYACGKKISALDGIHAIFALFYFRFFS